jgi:ribosomal protein S6--L-glutamate ligase
MLRIGFVSTRTRGDWQLERMARALGRAGRAERVEPSSLRVECGRDGAQDVLRVHDGPRDAARFDAVLVGRLAGPPVDEDLQLDALRALALLGVAVVNPVGALLAARDKLWTAVLLAAAGLPTPPCASVPAPGEAARALAATGEAAGKPLCGSLGEGLFRCGPGDRAALARAALAQPLLVQRFVPPGGTDFSLFVVGDRVEACVRRQAPPGGWKSNAAQGATATAAVAHRTWREVAVEAVRALGLRFGGVDLALLEGRPTVLEVNGFPGFRAVHAATGLDMADPVAHEVARAARRAAAHRRKPTTGAARRAGRGARPGGKAWR